MSKKNISWLLITMMMVFALVLTACGGAATEEPADMPSEPEVSEPEADEPEPMPEGGDAQVEVFSCIYFRVH